MIKYKYTDQDASDYAMQTSASVVIRSYKDGDSRDERRISTGDDASLIYTTVYAALLAIKHGDDEQSVMSMAEYIIHVTQNLRHIRDQEEGRINAYVSVFTPISTFLAKHQEVNQ